MTFIEMEITLEDKVNVSLYLSSVNPYSRDANYSIFPMLNTSTLDSNEANFSITFAPDVTYSANEYSFFILVNDTSGFYNASLQKFVIQDEPPDIYESQSYIGAVPFTMQYSETYWGATIPISIVGTDEEDNISQMDAYFLIFNVMEVGMYLMAYDVVLSQKINYDEAAGRFSGSVHIPIDGISTMLNEKYYLGDHYYIAFAILRDSDGGWDETSYAYTLLIINTPLDLLIEFMQYYEEPTNYTPLIITICVASATAVIIAIYYLRSSKKEQVFLKKIIKGDETNVDSVIRDLLRDKKKQGDD
jgi:hypothetical protein